MKRKIIPPIFFLILLLVTVQIVEISASTNFAPAWVKPSAFAEYEGETSGLYFLNGTFFSAKSKTGDEAIFRWTCIEQNETTAKLQVQLDFGDGLHLTATIFVNMANRDVYLTNGT
jgi:hypothetical protein